MSGQKKLHSLSRKVDGPMICKEMEITSKQTKDFYKIKNFLWVNYAYLKYLVEVHLKAE